MESMESYQKFSEFVDQCDDPEVLQNYRKDNTAIAMRNEFWKQRRIVFETADPLEKQRALTKMQWLQRFFGCQIPALRVISQFTAPEGLYGIFISAKTTLGSGCVIFPHVSILADTLPDSPTAGFPMLGDNVHIGAGARIVGSVVIGSNVRIAPNCCVTADIPSNSIVAPDGTVTRLEAPPATQYLSQEQFLKQRFSKVFYDYAKHIGDPRLHVRKAEACDIDTVFQLYKDRIAWFKWKKQTQWGHYLLTHPKDEFLEAIDHGSYYLILLDSEVIGGFALLNDSAEWEDETASAFYLRRAVSRVGYQHLSGYIASEAKRLTREAGKDFLRLECITSNQQLNAIWENQGFVFVRSAESFYHCNLREWKAAEEQE